MSNIYKPKVLRIYHAFVKIFMPSISFIDEIDWYILLASLPILKRVSLGRSIAHLNINRFL